MSGTSFVRNLYLISKLMCVDVEGELKRGYFGLLKGPMYRNLCVSSLVFWSFFYLHIKAKPARSDALSF